MHPSCLQQYRSFGSGIFVCSLEPDYCFFNSILQKFSRDMPYAYFPGRIAGRKDNLPPYAARCRLLGLEPLSVRRRNAHCSFIAGLLNGSIDSSPLLHRVDIDAPSRTLRSRKTLRLAQPRSNAGRSDLMSRMSAVFNTVSDCFDFNIYISYCTLHAD